MNNMREILFKAKRKDNGEWVEGYYLNIAKINHFICTGKIKLDGALKGIIAPEMYAIDPDTICQYTGLTDKNGNKIWENDIAHIRSRGLSGYGVVKYQNGNLVLVDEKRKRTYSLYGEWKIRKDGNVFDNVDLLEVK